MNFVSKTLLMASLLVPLTALASPQDDVNRIRPLLPAGTDIAQIQARLLRGDSEADAIDGARSNYLIRDINGDGREDVLVISEETPRFEDYTTDQPCASENEPNCMMRFGKRALHFFIGQADGSLRLAFTNESMILGADDGGVFGDPLEGFALRPNGTIVYSVYGGSAWRWSYADTIQFRGGDLYVIGQDSYEGWTGDLRADTKSINLLTGRVVETHQKNADARVHVKTYHVPVKPLVKVSDYQGDME